MALSLWIMIGLTIYEAQMVRFFAPETRYVIASLLSPVGFVLQDVVADAMTVESVPSYTAEGFPIPEAEIKRMHITMQTLGRIAIIGGSAMVTGIGGWLAKTLFYLVMYEVGLCIPAISVLGVIFGQINPIIRCLSLIRKDAVDTGSQVELHLGNPSLYPNWYILGGSAFSS